MFSFLVRASVIFLVLSGIIFWLAKAPWIQLPTSLHIFNIAYFVLAIFTHSVLMRSTKKTGARFITAFMGMVTLKLLLTMAALGIYLYFFKENKVSLGIGVFVIYMAYTIFEVVFLQKELRK